MNQGESEIELPKMPTQRPLLRSSTSEFGSLADLANLETDLNSRSSRTLVRPTFEELEIEPNYSHTSRPIYRSNNSSTSSLTNSSPLILDQLHLSSSAGLLESTKRRHGESNRSSGNALEIRRASNFSTDSSEESDSDEFDEKVHRGYASEKLDGRHQHHKHRQMNQSSTSFFSRYQIAEPNGELDSHRHVLYPSSSGKRFIPPLMLLVPVLIVLFLTAGLASGMLYWVLTHQLPLSSPGVIYVREGFEDELGRRYKDESSNSNGTLTFNTEISHTTTLSFSSIISTLVSNSVYPLMSLVAYSLAADWLFLQAKVASSSSVNVIEELPTPLQYTLLVQLCSTQWSALVDSLHHVLGGKGSKAHVPKILIKAMIWLTVLLSLTSAVGWTDFWLHETTKTVEVISVNDRVRNETFGMALNTTTCPTANDLTSSSCLVSPSQTNGLPLYAQSTDWGKSYVGQEGWLVARNSSNDHAVLIMDDVDPSSEIDGLSYVINPKSHRQDIYQTSTIGLKTQCQIITSKCRANAESFDCSNINRPELQSKVVGADQTVPYNNLASAIYLIDQTNNFVGSNSTVAASSNPVTVSILMSYSLPGSGSLTELSKDGFVPYQVGTSPYVYSLAECSLSFKDLNLDYFNSTFSIASEDGIKNSSAAIAHSLTGPILAGLITNLALDPLAKLIGRVSTKEFEENLSKDLSFNTLAMSAGLLQQVDVEVKSWEDILASQYQKAPLYIYLGLLYSFSVVAVFLFFWAWCTSSDCITWDHPSGKHKVQIPAAVLAQRVLMDPSHLISTHLSNAQNYAHHTTTAAVSTMLAHATSASVSNINLVPSNPLPSSSKASATPVFNRQAVIRTAATNTLDLFDEPSHQERVVVGLESNGRGFGVWPASSALGAVGRSEDGQRDSMLRARMIWSTRDRKEGRLPRFHH